MEVLNCHDVFVWFHAVQLLAVSVLLILMASHVHVLHVPNFLYTYPNNQPSWQASFFGGMFHIIGCSPEVLCIDPAQNNHPTHIAQLACKLRAIRCHADASPLLFTEMSLQRTSHAANESDIEIESVWVGEQVISILCLFVLLFIRLLLSAISDFERMESKFASITNFLLKLNCC